MKTIIWLAVLCLGITVRTSAAEPHFLFLLFGGFHSQQERGDLFMYRQLKGLTPAARTSYVLVSFTGSQLKPWSTEEMYVEILPEDPIEPPYHDDSKTDPGSLLSLIRRQIRIPSDTYVVLVGHSHGGWWAMQTVLSLPPGAHILRLATLDPISWIRCDPANYSSTLSLNPSGQLGAEYTHAPSDLISEEPEIARRVHPGRWANFYQTEFPLLHSSPIERADKNILRVYSGGESVVRPAHIQIFSDPAIWSEIRAWVREDVGHVLSDY